MSDLRDALEWCLDYIEGTDVLSLTRAPLAEPFFSERIAQYRALAALPVSPADPPSEHRLYARNPNIPRGEDDPAWCVCGVPWPCPSADPPHPVTSTSQTEQRLAGDLRDARFSPPDNECVSCGHGGWEHDLGNWCLVCPRPDDWDRTAKSPTGAKVDAGWCYFGSMTKPERRR